MRKITWNEFFSRLAEIELGEYDEIVAIGQGGIIPAGFVQYKTNLPMKILSLNYRDENHEPRFDEVKLTEEMDFSVKGKRVLLVDDVSRTGKTIIKAEQVLDSDDIDSFVVNGEADINMFNEQSCILMPWKRYF